MTKSIEYCPRIEDTFEIGCSKAGITHFRCPRAEIRTEEGRKKVYCRAVGVEEECVPYSRIELIIKTINEREAPLTFWVFSPQ